MQAGDIWTRSAAAKLTFYHTPHVRYPQKGTPQSIRSGPQLIDSNLRTSVFIPFFAPQRFTATSKRLHHLASFVSHAAQVSRLPLLAHTASELASLTAWLQPIYAFSYKPSPRYKRLFRSATPSLELILGNLTHPGCYTFNRHRCSSQEAFLYREAATDFKSSRKLSSAGRIWDNI